MKILLYFLVAIPVFSQNVTMGILHEQNFNKQLFASSRAGILFPGSSQPITTSSEPKTKKPPLGGLFSAVVPGTGEMYAGAWWKGALFLGAEVALWVGYNHYADKGQEWDEVFHVFADQHWSEPEYWVFIAQQANIHGVNENNYPEYLESLRTYEHAHYSHGLHIDKDQQYYEMIGKYDQFVRGWDDFAEGQTVLTPNRNRYLDMRNNSNRQFKKASTCAMIAVANHVLSAFDAALTIKKENRKLEAKFRTGLKTIGEKPVPFFAFQMNW